MHRHIQTLDASHTVLLALAAPAVGFAATRDARFLRVLALLVVVSLVSLGIKAVFHTWAPGCARPWLERPHGATCCDALGSDTSDVGGEPGFPSGHVAVAAAAATAATLAFTQAGTVARAVAGVAGVTWVVAVAASRLRRRCHNVPQVLGGALLGAFMGAV